ncbi:hypothetical protein Droror1_Dr00014309 [Drosera rotundifolia]
MTHPCLTLLFRLCSRFPLSLSPFSHVAARSERLPNRNYRFPNRTLIPTDFAKSNLSVCPNPNPRRICISLLLSSVFHSPPISRRHPPPPLAAVDRVEKELVKRALIFDQI